MIARGTGANDVDGMIRSGGGVCSKKHRSDVVKHTMQVACERSLEGDRRRGRVEFSSTTSSPQGKRTFAGGIGARVIGRVSVVFGGIENSGQTCRQFLRGRAGLRRVGGHVVLVVEKLGLRAVECGSSFRRVEGMNSGQTRPTVRE